MTDLFQSIAIIFLAVSTIFNIVAIGGLRKRIYSLEESRNLLDEQFRNIR